MALLITVNFLTTASSLILLNTDASQRFPRAVALSVSTENLSIDV